MIHKHEEEISFKRSLFAPKIHYDRPLCTSRIETNNNLKNAIPLEPHIQDKLEANRKRFLPLRHQYPLSSPICISRLESRLDSRGSRRKTRRLANPSPLPVDDRSLRASSIPHLLVLLLLLMLLFLLVLVPWKHGSELVLKAPWYIELERLSIVGEASLDGPERQLAKSVHGQRDVHAGPFVPLGQLASLEVAIPGEPRLREEHVPLIHRVPGKTGVQPSFRSLFHSI